MDSSTPSTIRIISLVKNSYPSPPALALAVLTYLSRVGNYSLEFIGGGLLAVATK